MTPSDRDPVHAASDRAGAALMEARYYAELQRQALNELEEAVMFLRRAQGSPASTDFLADLD